MLSKRRSTLTTSGVLPLTGASQYVARTSFRGLTAVLLTVAIFGLSSAAGLALAVALAEGTPIIAPVEMGQVDDVMQNGPFGFILATMAATQIFTIVLTIWVAGRFGNSAWRVLSLERIPGGVRTLALSFVVVLIVSSIYSSVMFNVAPEVVKQDLSPYLGMARSDALWPLLVIVAVGAPLAEELLFRGFLLSALAKTPVGFAGGAVIATGIWAVLHAQYSAAGVAAVMILGLAFSWLLWRTGSLWVPIICHGLYNAVVMIVVWAMATGAVTA